MQPDDPVPGPQTDPAIARFWTLRLVQLLGILVAMAGAASLAGKLDMPQWAAGLLLAAGIGIFFGLPGALAQKWKAEK